MTSGVRELILQQGEGMLREINLKKKKGKNKEEQKLLNACLGYLKLRGCIAIRNNSGVIFLSNGDGTQRAVRAGMQGASDIIGCLPNGKFLAVECKSKKGRLTESQAQFLESVRVRGGVALVIRDLEELHTAIEQELKKGKEK